MIHTHIPPLNQKETLTPCTSDFNGLRSGSLNLCDLTWGKKAGLRFVILWPRVGGTNLSNLSDIIKNDPLIDNFNSSCPIYLMHSHDEMWATLSGPLLTLRYTYLPLQINVWYLFIPAWVMNMKVHLRSSPVPLSVTQGVTVWPDILSVWQDPGSLAVCALEFARYLICLNVSKRGVYFFLHISK